MKTSSIVALAGLLIGCFNGGQNQPAPPTTDQARLQGYWEGPGPGGVCSVNIVGKSLFFYRDENFWFDTEFTLPPDTDPAQLQATILKDSSEDQRDVGTVVGALFRFEGDRLILVSYGDVGPPDSIDDAPAGDTRYDLARKPAPEGRTRPPKEKRP